MADPPPQGGLGQSWFVLDFEAAYVGYKPPEFSGGGETPGIFGPAFRFDEFEHGVPGALVLRRKVETETYVLAQPGILHLERRRMFVFPGHRTAAERVLLVRRDDEECLLLL